MVSKGFNLLCQNGLIWKELFVLRINNLRNEFIFSTKDIDRIVLLLKDICIRYNHLQLPRWYFCDISKKFIEMERVHFIKYRFYKIYGLLI